MVDNNWSNSPVISGSYQGNATQGYKSFRVSDGGEAVNVDRYGELALRGKVFRASRTAVTVPVNASNLVSVFSLYNPPSSGVFLDIVEATAHEVLATTVVDVIGLYFQTGSLVASATFTTRDTTDVQSARLGEGNSPQGQFYSALTHSGTPALADFIGGWGAVTDSGVADLLRQFNGRLLLPPNGIISLAMSTAASTASGIAAALTWAEIPYVSP